MAKSEINVVKVSDSKGKVTPKSIIEGLLHSIDGQINGSQPWDIQVHNENLYQRILTDGGVGLGEAYMDKWWDCQRLDIFMEKIFKAKVDSQIHVPFHFKLKQILAKIVNFQTKRLAKQVALKHYNLGNQLFSTMLDKHMNYSCGYWKSAHSLEEAQIAKLELICQKLQLKPGQTMLDIGCGWGGLARYAAEKHGVSVVGVTISQQQCEFAQEYCKGLPIQIRLQDYRDINETFDRVVSVGMFEHVGHLNYRTFMETVHRSLANDGLFLLVFALA